jgi:hypothetical protein
MLPRWILCLMILWRKQHLLKNAQRQTNRLDKTQKPAPWHVSSFCFKKQECHLSKPNF